MIEADPGQRQLYEATRDLLAGYERLSSRVQARKLHRSAALVVRCSDCPDRPGHLAIGWVLWSDRRPVLVARQRPGWMLAYLDDGYFADPTAWCRDVKHQLSRETLLPILPEPGFVPERNSKQRTVSVSHPVQR